MLFSDQTLSLFEQVDLSHFSLPPPRPSLPRSEEPERERLDPQWSTLLTCAVEDPLLLQDAFAHFPEHSLGNGLAAIIQCRSRALEPGPIRTLPAWRAAGRKIIAGEKALALCSPLESASGEPMPEQEIPEQAGGLFDAAEMQTLEISVWKRRWFLLSQTEPYNGYEALPDESALAPACWSRQQAFKTLNVEWFELREAEDGLQGFARGRTVAVAKTAIHPERSLFHALAHVVLGHIEQIGLEEESRDFRDYGALDSTLREVEAESVAMLLLGTLALPGADAAGDFVEFWTEHGLLAEPTCRRIFEAADSILQAGLIFRTQSPTRPSSVPDLVKPETRPPPDDSLSAKSTAPDGVQDAWRLFYRLQTSHRGLHPQEALERRGIAQALRYLEQTDPEAAQEIVDSVKQASRLLKSAGERLAGALEGIPQPEPIVPQLTMIKSTLSPTRHAAATRCLGRKLRSDLESERRRFFAVAARYELATDAKASKAMLRALSEFLQIPIKSRRELTETQWARATSAIESHELQW